MAEHQRYLYGAEAEEAPGGVKRDPFAPKHLSQPDYDRIQLLAKSGDAEWLDVQTVALVMGVSKWTIYRAIKRGEIPFVRIGKQIRVNKRALNETMRRRTEGGE